MTSADIYRYQKIYEETGRISQGARANIAEYINCTELMHSVPELLALAAVVLHEKEIMERVTHRLIK